MCNLRSKIRPSHSPSSPGPARPGASRRNPTGQRRARFADGMASATRGRHRPTRWAQFMFRPSPPPRRRIRHAIEKTSRGDGHEGGLSRAPRRRASSSGRARPRRRDRISMSAASLRRGDDPSPVHAQRRGRIHRRRVRAPPPRGDAPPTSVAGTTLAVHAQRGGRIPRRRVRAPRGTRTKREDGSSTGYGVSSASSRGRSAMHPPADAMPGHIDTRPRRSYRTGQEQHPVHRRSSSTTGHIPPPSPPPAPHRGRA